VTSKKLDDTDLRIIMRRLRANEKHSIIAADFRITIEQLKEIKKDMKKNPHSIPGIGVVK
jgi:uncharacterized protein (DUF433 family)